MGDETPLPPGLGDRPPERPRFPLKSSSLPDRATSAPGQHSAFHLTNRMDGEWPIRRVLLDGSSYGRDPGHAVGPLARLDLGDDLQLAEVDDRDLVRAVIPM